MAANTWAAFSALFPTQRLQMGTVTATLAGGRVVVTTPEGGTVIVKADVAINTKITFRGDQMVETLSAGGMITLDV